VEESNFFFAGYCVIIELRNLWAKWIIQTVMLVKGFLYRSYLQATLISQWNLCNTLQLFLASHSHHRRLLLLPLLPFNLFPFTGEAWQYHLRMTFLSPPPRFVPMTSERLQSEDRSGTPTDNPLQTENPP
jgi:hypothetical protein